MQLFRHHNESSLKSLTSFQHVRDKLAYFLNIYVILYFLLKTSISVFERDEESRRSNEALERILDVNVTFDPQCLHDKHQNLRAKFINWFKEGPEVLPLLRCQRPLQFA